MGFISSIIGGVGSIVGGIMGANAAGKAANAEVKGAQDAQALEKQNQDAANAAQQTALGNVTAAQQPYQALGSTSANHLADLISKGFTAPTLADAEATPGFQFRMKEGTDAIDRSAAASGTLFTGNTGKALADYGQNLAESTYNDDYSRALQTYMANVNPLLQGAQLGLSSTGQLTNANLDVAGNTANIDMNAGRDQAQQINNAAAARASGYLGKNQAYQSMIGGATSLAPTLFGRQDQ
jgi:hypothetical protein